MAVIDIATPPVGVYRWLLRQRFDGRFFRLFYKWNPRIGFWMVDVANDTNEAQIRNVKMCLGQDKLRIYKYRDVPQGELSVVDSTGTGTEPTLEDFGGRVMVQYTEFVDDTVIPEPDEPEVALA